MDKDRIDRVKQIQRSDCLQFLDFDLKYNIDTFGPVEQSKDGLNQTKPASVDNHELFEGSSGYQPSALHWLDTINEYFEKNINIENYSFVDVGSGKGKVIFYNLIKLQKYKNYIGIEIDQKYHDIAVNNLKTINIQINKEVEFVNDDARNFDYSRSNSIYYFFFPFSLEIFKEIMNNNLKQMSNKNNYLVFLFEQVYDIENNFKIKPVFVNDAVSIYKID